MYNLLILVQNLAIWAYGAVFLGMLLESLGLPLPGQTLALVAAVIAGQGQLNFWLVFSLTIVGGQIGSVISYWIGHKGGRGLLKRCGSLIWVTPARLAVAEAFFARHGYKTLLLSRYLPILCFASSLLSGITRLNFRRFCLANLLGLTLWTTTHLTLALLLGNSLHLLNQTLKGFGLLVTIGVVFAIIFTIVAKTKINLRNRRNRHGNIKKL